MDYPQFSSSSEICAIVRAEPSVPHVPLRIYIGFNKAAKDTGNHANLHITIECQGLHSEDRRRQVIPIILRQYSFLPKHEANNCTSISLGKDEDLFVLPGSGMQNGFIQTRFQYQMNSTWNHQLQSQSGFYMFDLDIQALPKVDTDYSLKIGVAAQGPDYEMKERHHDILCS
ncbi:hypothetical protein H1R20_g1140, partial [Candolleomyces eurysporus]